ncbi:uncharacterized protein LOC144903054 [Branchiostoma floridae x Branchiostoma belcheri]
MFLYATTACQLDHDGGTLAIPRDAGINAFLLNLIAMHAHPPSSFWFGLHDRDYEGQWTWVDGTALGDGYTAWIPGQPDNSRDRQDCVYYRGDWSYLWDDRECNAAYFYICQVFSSGSPPPTTDIPTTTRPETSPRPSTTQATSTQSQVSSTPRLTQQSTLPGTVSQHPITQTAQRPTLPGTSVSQHPTIQTTHQTTLPGTTVSQSPTNQTTKLAGGAWDENKQLDITLVSAGCAVGLVGMCGVLLYCVKRRQRRRQVAQTLEPQS